MWLATGMVTAQNPTLEVVLCFQKTLNVYYENEITNAICSSATANQPAGSRFNYVTSRLGSASGSYALETR